MATSTPPCRGTSVAAGPTRASARESSARHARRQMRRRRADMPSNQMIDSVERDGVDLSRRRFLTASAAVGGGLLIGFTAGATHIVEPAGPRPPVAPTRFIPAELHRA